MTFQELLMTLERFWAERGCVIQQPYDIEVGAGTFNPATLLRVLGPEPWNVAYVEPSRRPTDGRYGENPNRLQHYYQYQVIIKPSPLDIQDIYLHSLRELGVGIARVVRRLLPYPRMDARWTVSPARFSPDGDGEADSVEAELAIGSRDPSPEKVDRFIVLATAAFAVLNVGIAVLFGFAAYHASKRGWLKV